MWVIDVKINCGVWLAASPGMGNNLSYESSCAHRDMTHKVHCSSVMWLTIRHRRGTELFANELTGSSSGACSLLHLLMFQETFSGQCGCRCELWNIKFYLFYLSRKKRMTENPTPLEKMSLPPSLSGTTLKGCSQKHQLEISRCWQHVTASPSIR